MKENVTSVLFSSFSKCFPCTFFTFDYSLLSLSCSCKTSPPQKKWLNLDISPDPLILFTVPLPKLNVPPTLYIHDTYPYHVPWTNLPLCLPCPLTLSTLNTYFVTWPFLPSMPTMSPEAISDPIYLVPWHYLPPMPTMSPEAESDPLPFLSTLSPDPIYPLYLPCPPILFIPYPCHVPWPYLPPTSVMSPDPIYPLPPPLHLPRPCPFST